MSVKRIGLSAVLALMVLWTGRIDKAAAQGAAPTDPQIAHIAYTAGKIDIQAAEFALKTSQNKQVRDFAEEMGATTRR